MFIHCVSIHCHVVIHGKSIGSERYLDYKIFLNSEQCSDLLIWVMCHHLHRVVSPRRLMSPTSSMFSWLTTNPPIGQLLQYSAAIGQFLQKYEAWAWLGLRRCPGLLLVWEDSYIKYKLTPSLPEIYFKLCLLLFPSKRKYLCYWEYPGKRC